MDWTVYVMQEEEDIRMAGRSEHPWPKLNTQNELNSMQNSWERSMKDTKKSQHAENERNNPFDGRV